MQWRERSQKMISRLYERIKDQEKEMKEADRGVVDLKRRTKEAITGMEEKIQALEKAREVGNSSSSSRSSSRSSSSRRRRRESCYGSMLLSLTDVVWWDKGGTGGGCRAEGNG